MAFMFEKLEVYQKAVDFAEQIISLTEHFPRGYYFLSDQLNRASLSISTNIAEGNGRFTKSDRRIFLSLPEAVRRSAFHCWKLPKGKNLSRKHKRWSCITSLKPLSKCSAVLSMASKTANSPAGWALSPPFPLESRRACPECIRLVFPV
jgi:hypothetical protein